MLDRLQYDIRGEGCHYEGLEAFLEMPFPQTPEEMMQMEEQLYRRASQVGDSVLLAQIIKAHKDETFVEKAVKKAQERAALPLARKGWKETSILLPGGSRAVLKTPYLREETKGRRGRKRKKRGKKGTGVYPVLEALGICDGVSPATRREIALLTVQAASYQEAVSMLERKGFFCDVSTLVRIADATAKVDISLRDAALSTAMSIPVRTDGPLAGKRVRVSLDGGRVRTRKERRGRKTRKGRHAFDTPWREPRVLAIDILTEEGKPDRLRLPLYDTILDNAEATFSLLIGYLRLLGAAHAEVVEFISDGADWIWDRVGRLVTQAEIPQSRLVLAIDFYHASGHLYEAVELCHSLSRKERRKLYEQLRHTLRHDEDGVLKVIDALKERATTRRGKKMKKAIAYFDKYTTQMNYTQLDGLKLPVGSGQVESTVRRVINLRFKSAGSFWDERIVGDLMHLRAYFKAGRWDELIKRVLAKQFYIPSFAPVKSVPSVATEMAGTYNSPLIVADLQEAA